MSVQFVEKYGHEPVLKETMRAWCQRPGKRDSDGNIQYTTEQAHKNQCDVNRIIEKYDKRGIITHVSKFEAKFGDLTGLDFKSMQDQVANAKSMFSNLPGEIRALFENDPANLLTFMENPDNRDEAIKLGLIDPTWTPETDGLGEHVKDGENEPIKPPEEPPVKTTSPPVEPA